MFLLQVELKSQKFGFITTYRLSKINLQEPTKWFLINRLVKPFFLTFQSFVFTCFCLLGIQRKQKIEQITKQIKNQQHIIYVCFSSFIP